MTMKKKNEGFTLVELVIAVVILAIAVSPLVSNFIQSGRMNLKSRKALNAMNLAQDIMEGMSQYTVSQNTAFFDAAGVSSNTLADHRILPGGTTVTGCTLSGLSTEEKKIYLISGIQTASGNYNNYDVTVTFDSGAAGTNLANINAHDIADIQGIDMLQDVAFTYDSTKTNEDLTALRNKSNDITAPLSTYAGKVNRTFTLSFTKTANPAGGNDYSCKVVAGYTADTSLGFTAGNADYTAYRTPTMVSQSKMPRAFYFYFEGLPGAKRVGADSLENIKIVNSTGEPITVYLVRIVEEDPISHTIDTVYNTDYTCDVTVDGFKEDGITHEDNVDLVSNLRLNLAYNYVYDTEANEYDNFRLYEEGTLNRLSGVTDQMCSVSHYKAARSKITYNGAIIDEDTYKAHVSDGYRKTNKKLLYEVTVDIREHGKSNIMATYTGGLSN